MECWSIGPDHPSIQHSTTPLLHFFSSEHLAKLLAPTFHLLTARQFHRNDLLVPNVFFELDDTSDVASDFYRRRTAQSKPTQRCLTLNAISFNK